MNQLDKFQPLIGKFGVELLSDAFNIQSFLQPAGDLQHIDIAGLIKLGYIHEHGAELAQEQVAWLTVHVQVLAGDRAFSIAFDPIPKALRALTIEKDQQVFIEEFCCIAVDSGAQLSIGQRPRGRSHFEDNDPRQLGDGSQGE